MDSEKIQQANYFEKKYNRGGRALGGLLLVVLGALWLVHRMNLVLFPTWVFTWPVFLIALGIYIGIRKGFAGGGWQVLLIIGAVFLLPHLYWYYTGKSISEYTWPLVVIALGLYMIIRPRHNFRNSVRFHGHWKDYGDKWKDTGKDWKQNYAATGGQSYGATSGDDFVDETSVFGGVHKVVVSKNFKGGDVVNIFGGCDLNLTQARLYWNRYA